MTKLELEQRLLASQRDNEALRVRIAELEGDVAALKSQLEAAEAHGELNRVLRANQRVRPVFEPTPEQLARRAAMAAAKAEAIARGCSVRVE